MTIDDIAETILDQQSSPEELRLALDSFVSLCVDAGDIAPDASFSAWAGDSLLEGGVAINPGAAAHCVSDYRRSVVFMRGVYAALVELRSRFKDSTLQVLYAGCGPYATLILPLLGKFLPGDIKVYLLDAHQASLDNVKLLLTHFGFNDHSVEVVEADACNYRHPSKPHLILAETMQKALEQEPQFAVTANLAPQLCDDGIYMPQRIEVSLCLADLKPGQEINGLLAEGIDGKTAPDIRKNPLATVATLCPKTAFGQMQRAQAQADGPELYLEPVVVTIPEGSDIDGLEAALFTRITVFGDHLLEDYECQLTLPSRCYDLLPLIAGASYRVTYQLGGYPKFSFEKLALG
ncbi:MAG: hypothetical protein ABJK25_03720 [Halieaceae bacterium]